MSAAADLPKQPEFMGIFYQPWVSGYRTEAWGGPMLKEIWIDEHPVDTRAARFLSAVHELTDAIEEGCHVRQMNAFVGVEFTLNPWLREERNGVWTTGMRLSAVGTCARLERLYPAPVPAPDLFRDILP